MQYRATWGVCVFVCVRGGFQVIITFESLTHLHGGEFIWPPEMKIMHKHVALCRKRRRKDKEKKGRLIRRRRTSVEGAHGMRGGSMSRKCISCVVRVYGRRGKLGRAVYSPYRVDGELNDFHNHVEPMFISLFQMIWILSWKIKFLWQKVASNGHNTGISPPA